MAIILGILFYGVALVIGIILFSLLNEMFNVYYFGFGGVFATFMGCWGVGTAILAILGMASVVIIPIVVVIWLLVKIFGGGSKQTT